MVFVIICVSTLLPFELCVYLWLQICKLKGQGAKIRQYDEVYESVMQILSIFHHLNLDCSHLGHYADKNTNS